jgi:imidazolonepropionase-like amidohydrolase
MLRPFLAVLSLLVASAIDAKPLAITGVTVYDGTSATARFSDAVIVIQGERLLCVGSRSECPIPDGAETIDYRGRFITPGLIDSHVHFMLGNWFDTRQDSGIAADRYDYEAATKD